MTIEELEQQIKALQDEIDKLKDEQTKSDIEFSRVSRGENYYYIPADGKIESTSENYENFDNNAFLFGNYYLTKELAEQDRKELALRNKIRQLRDIYCQGYEFIYYKNNFYIYFDYNENYFYISDCAQNKSIGEIYFDTEEHAQQACDILNRKLKNGNIKI